MAGGQGPRADRRAEPPRAVLGRGNDPHSVWVLPLDAQDRRPVLVYLGAGGLVTRDWSEAAQSRREASRAAKRYGTAA